MSLELRAMSSSQASAWLPSTMEDYITQRVLSGEDPETARRQANQQSEQFAPQGVPSSDHHFFWLFDGGETVGALWLCAPTEQAKTTWFVYYVVVYDTFRGRGFGRAAMLAAEQWSRDHDGQYLALNVFGHNHVARELYDSLGFEPMATLMRKSLS